MLFYVIVGRAVTYIDQHVMDNNKITFAQLKNTVRKYIRPDNLMVLKTVTVVLTSQTQWPRAISFADNPIWRQERPISKGALSFSRSGFWLCLTRFKSDSFTQDR